MKKLIVAVASSAGRSIGECQRYDMPAFTCPRSAASAGGSCGWIDDIVNAETRNEHESTISAAGAENAWTRSPPMLGPATNESARLPFKSEFASRYRSRGTSETKSVMYET